MLLKRHEDFGCKIHGVSKAKGCKPSRAMPGSWHRQIFGLSVFPGQGDHPGNGREIVGCYAKAWRMTKIATQADYVERVTANAVSRLDVLYPDE